MSFSLIDALMALVPAAKHGKLVDHAEVLTQALDDQRVLTALWRDEARRLRIEVERLNQGAHRCQHQADLNRAMAQQAQAYPQMAVGLLGQQAQQGLGQMQYAAMQNQQAACHRSLDDCGMHHAQMLNRLNRQR